jgi:UDP-glucuronate 4-epimerase
MQKIILVGGEGFVGKAMRIELIINGYEVDVYDLVNGDDTRDRFKLDKLFETKNYDIVINLAARAGVRRGNDFPEEYFSTNVFGLKNLIELAEKYGVKRFIHYSSSSVYGKKEPSATKEEEVKKPKSIYGITKLVGELLLENSNLDYTIIRPFTIVGENGREEMVIYKWINQIKAGRPVTFYGDGSTFRGYTYIGDMIRGTIECINNSKSFREDFNLGGDQVVTLEELWNIFKDVCPEAKREKLPMPSCDQAYSLANTSKTKKLLNWEHQTNIKEKIQEILEHEINGEY